MKQYFIASACSRSSFQPPSTDTVGIASPLRVSITLSGGSFSKTAADGSKLNGVHTGTWHVLPGGTQIRFDLTSTFTGGTGRFAGAGGTCQTVAFMDIATGRFEYEKNGTLVKSRYTSF